FLIAARHCRPRSCTIARTLCDEEIYCTAGFRPSHLSEGSTVAVEDRANLGQIYSQKLTCRPPAHTSAPVALFAQLLKDEVAVLNMLLLHRPEVFQQSAGMGRVISVTI